MSLDFFRFTFHSPQRIAYYLSNYRAKKFRGKPMKNIHYNDMLPTMTVSVTAREFAGLKKLAKRHNMTVTEFGNDFLAKICAVLQTRAEFWERLDQPERAALRKLTAARVRKFGR
jgi:hypothetical protein